MSAGVELRGRLFNDYAAQFAALPDYFEDAPAFQDTFVCPFCKGIFGRDALDPPAQVSIEHCIPEAVGGTLSTVTLTCTQCNNDMGSAIDSQLKSRFDAEDFLAGLSGDTTRAWITVGDGGQVRADMRLSNRDGQRSMDVYFDEKHSPPGHFDEAMRVLRAEAADPQGVSFDFNVEFRFNQRKAHVALLRIGFLMMFRQYGYSYILHPNVDCVRDQLLNPDEEIIPLPMSADIPAAAQHPNTVAILTRPADQRAFMVLVKLVTPNRTIYKGVLMPGMDDGGGSIYDRVSASVGPAGHLSASMQVVPYNPANITDARRLLAPYRDWAHTMGAGRSPL